MGHAMLGNMPHDLRFTLPVPLWVSRLRQKKKSLSRTACHHQKSNFFLHRVHDQNRNICNRLAP